MSEPRLALPDNYWYQSVLCDGSHTSQTRLFPNFLGFAIFLGDLAVTGLLKGPEDLPELIKLSNSTYHLVGITFWNGNHFNAQVHYDDKWYTYDGLQSVPLQLTLSYSAAVQTGYSMSSCVYFKEPPV